MLNLINIGNQITSASSVLLSVLIVMMLSHSLITNYFSNFVKPITLTIFALTQLLLPPLLLEKRFLFDVGFNCKIMITMQLMLMISFSMNPPKELGVTILESRGNILLVFSLQNISLIFKRRSLC